MSKPEGRRKRRGCLCRQPWIHLVRLVMLTVSFVFSYLYLYQHSWLLRPTHPLVLFEAISTTSHGYALAISSWWWEGTCSLTSFFQGKCNYKYKYLVSKGFLAQRCLFQDEIQICTWCEKAFCDSVAGRVIRLWSSHVELVVEVLQGPPGLSLYKIRIEEDGWMDGWTTWIFVYNIYNNWSIKDIPRSQ